MRHLIIATLALTFSLDGFAAPELYDMGNGNTYYMVPNSGRQYQVNSMMQWDAVIAYGTANGDTISVRVAATGCKPKDTMRLTSRVNDDGSPSSKVMAWNIAGNRLLDEWALRVCFQGLKDAS